MDTYKFYKQCNGTEFNYGDFEEKVGFLFDNYYVALKMYRSIIKQMEEIDEKRINAHQQLQKLRSDEDRWKTNGPPKGFDAEEHQRRKDILVELREMEYEIMWNGRKLEHNKLSNFIMIHMGMFKRIEVLDRKCRNTIAPIAKTTAKILLWPMIKMMIITASVTDSPNAEEYLERSAQQLSDFPDMVKDKIII
ncbi:MAG: hypothetical protein K9L62_10405 [Vallitaleaceae bacterium]|nr:hypothetical protein [Vallitaleaceae bacterium]